MKKQQKKILMFMHKLLQMYIQNNGETQNYHESRIINEKFRDEKLEFNLSHDVSLLLHLLLNLQNIVMLGQMKQSIVE